MFDTHIQKLGYPSHTSISVHEHKAPTDESVKLLAELEKKAQEKVDKAVRVGNTPIDVVIHTYDDWSNHHKKFAIHYKLNGKQYKVNESIPLHWLDDEEGIARALIKALSEHIAINLLQAVDRSLRSLIRD
ncbi:hypothetical protein [Chryseobacterium sp.]|uniref:hypothetical protein n=1 Tax=Chryseobacterium sp. TaxID=1871047 RepID=UPI00321912CF